MNRILSVRVRPSGAEIPVAEGEGLMAAAVRNGYRWPSICGGEGRCTACFVQVEEGRAAVAPPEQAEVSALELVRLRFRADPDRVRLACQLRVFDNGVVVFRPGVRPLSRRKDDQ